MRRSRRGSRPFVWGVLLLAPALVACTDDTPAPPGGGGGGGGPGLGMMTTEDGGGSGPDGGTTDAGLPVGCATVRSADERNTATVTDADGTELPFEVTRVYAMWAPADCDTPEPEREILVGLTADTCVPGRGQRLVFRFDAANVGVAITTGANNVETPDFIVTNYVRPVDAGTGSPRWSNQCAGARGTVTLNALGSSAGDRWDGTFDMTLPPCSEAVSDERVLDGRFEVVLRRSFDEACRPVR